MSGRVLFCFLICCSPGAAIAQKKQTALKISPETTRITKPLDSRGFVDYVQAINDIASRGVNTENNAEVVFREVLGPKEISESMRNAYYQKLGIPVSNDDSFVEYFASRNPQGQPLPRDQYDRANQAPWQADDLPAVASWLTTENAKLDRVVQATQRERYYTPYIAEEFDDIEDAYPRMISILLPSVQGQRELARSLKIRINFHLGSGEIDAAWGDVMAIYRMSRLASTGITLIEELVGIALDSIAFSAAVDVLQSPHLTPWQARRCFTDLQQLKRLPPMSKKIDIGERFMGLDSVQTLATQPNLVKTLKLIDELSIDMPSPGNRDNDTTLVVFQKPAKPAVALPTGINWNVTAKMLNQWYDRVTAAAAEPDYQKRMAAFREIESGIEKLHQSVADSPATLLGILSGQKEDVVGEAIGKVLVVLLMPAIEAASRAEYEARTRMDILLIAFAAEVYRRDTGVFPSEPEKLVPRYLKQIPIDRMSGEPIQYKSVGQRLLLYSVGRNGKDDRGRGYEDNDDNDPQGWDDIVVRLSPKP